MTPALAFSLGKYVKKDVSRDTAICVAIIQVCRGQHEKMTAIQSFATDP